MSDVVAPYRRPTGVVLAAAALACAVASMVVLSLTDGSRTTYAGVSRTAAAVFIAAGLGLLLAGTVGRVQRPAGSTGPVTVLLGAVWLAPAWVGWQTGPALARSVAMVVVPFGPVLILHLALAHPGGRLSSYPSRVLVGIGYGATGVLSALRATLQHPYYDPYCWSNCTDNVLMIRSFPDFGRVLDAVRPWVLAVLALAAAAAAVARAGRNRGVLVPLALTAGAEAAYGVALALVPAEQPDQSGYLNLFYVRAAAYVLLAGGLVGDVLRRSRQRTAVARLTEELGDAPPAGSLQSVLARALGEPGLRVAYWLPGREQYVDVAGRPVEPRSDREHAVTEIRRRGERVAVVVHRRGLHSELDLERQIGSAARLAIDNERLRAGMLARVEELRLSRARIVEAADAERRRIERDLHDGAQQRLLALMLELRMAGSAAKAQGAEERSEVLARLADDTRTVLAELRELAHGIFPAVLDEAGLDAALLTLADSSPVPLVLAQPSGSPRETAGSRLPRAVERAVYLVVATASDRAEQPLTVCLERTAELLTVTVEGAVHPAQVHLTDRVGALGGRIASEPGMLRAEIPCEEIRGERGFNKEGSCG